jgi:hypothetical protein
MISGVFADGFKAGKDLANEQSQAEITRLQDERDGAEGKS